MSSISTAELDARFLAEERILDALSRDLALRRTDRSMARPSDDERDTVSRRFAGGADSGGLRRRTAGAA
jgi:hypothetical protein